MQSTKVRSGLYMVTTDDGWTYYVENRQSPPEYGGHWLWYITTVSGPDLWLDPTWTKREALEAIASYNREPDAGPKPPESGNMAMCY